MNRKGSLVDIGFLIAIFFVVSVLFFLLAHVMAEIKPELKTQLNASGLDNNTLDEILGKGTSSIDIMVNSIPMLIVMLGVASIALAFFIPVHPIFMPISLLLGIIYTIVSVLATNSIYNFINSTSIAAVANQHTLTVQVIEKFPYIITIIWILMIILQYGKAGNYE